MPVPTVNRDQAVALLMEIGDRRRELRDSEEELRKETRDALRVSAGLVSRAEAARLTGLNRSTIYELYLGDEDESDDGPAGAVPS